MPSFLSPNSRELSEFSALVPQEKKINKIKKEHDEACSKLLNFQISFDEFAPFRGELHQSREARKAASIAHWYFDSKTYLAEQEHRITWQEKSRNETFNECLHEWHKHGELADYSVPALRALDTHLDSIEIYLNQHQYELSKISVQNIFRIIFVKSVAWLEAQELRIYLNYEIGQNKIRQLKLVDAMLVRLQVASSTLDVTCDDIIHQTFLSAKTQGILKQDYSMPKIPRHGLNQDSFLYFHNTILTHGTVEQRDKLFKCYWYQSDKNTLIPTQHQKNTQYPVPCCLEGRVPASLIAELFYPIAEINGLFKQAQTNLTAPIAFLSLSQHPMLTKLSDCLTKLDALSNKLQLRDQTIFETILETLQFPQHNRAVRQLKKFIEQDVKNKFQENYIQFFKKIYRKLEVLLKEEGDFTQDENMRIRNCLTNFELAFHISTQDPDAEYTILKKQITAKLRELREMQERKLGEREARECFEEGLKIFSEGQYQNAIFKFEESLLSNPHNDGVRILKDFLLQQLNEGKQATLLFPIKDQQAYERSITFLTTQKSSKYASIVLTQLQELASRKPEPSVQPEQEQVVEAVAVKTVVSEKAKANSFLWDSMSAFSQLFRSPSNSPSKRSSTFAFGSKEIVEEAPSSTPPSSPSPSLSSSGSAE